MIAAALHQTFADVSSSIFEHLALEIAIIRLGRPADILDVSILLQYMQLRSVALYTGVDPETKPHGELLVFQFEPLGIDQSGLGIDCGHANAAGGQEGSDLGPELTGRHVDQRPSLTG